MSHLQREGIFMSTKKGIKLGVARVGVTFTPRWVLTFFIQVKNIPKNAQRVDCFRKCISGMKGVRFFGGRSGGEVTFSLSSGESESAHFQHQLPHLVHDYSYFQDHLRSWLSE